MPIETLIKELSSADGKKRAAATAEIFRRGKDVLPELKKAGAKQVAPFGGTLDTKRLDMIYSVLEGLPPNQVNARAGYRTTSFGLHVEQGTTEEEVRKLCQKHKCTLSGKFNGRARPSCFMLDRQAAFRALGRDAH